MTQWFWRLISTDIYRHSIYPKLQVKQAVRNFSSINFNYTYWLHRVLVLQNLLQQTFDFTRKESPSNKSYPYKFLICCITSKSKNCIKYSIKYRNFCCLLYTLHNSKLKMKLSLTGNSLLITELKYIWCYSNTTLSQSIFAIFIYVSEFLLQKLQYV